MSTTQLLLILASAVCATFSSETTIVDTPGAGRLRGARRFAWNQQRLWSFTGIPYARPPVGELRFAKPEPHPKFDDVFDATQDARFCPPASMFTPPVDPSLFSEDCLQLNVFVKSLGLSASASSGASRYTGGATDTKRKVIVFVHGGAFVFGKAHDHQPLNFVTTQDVIAVVINYRLGPFGFLSTGDDASPGNQALWDMVLALRWVKDNIAAFGGDPDDVTVSGESAGAAAITHLALSPVARGLFTKVYAASGAAVSPFALNPYPMKLTLEVAAALGCFADDNPSALGDGETANLSVSEKAEIISCLRQVPEDKLKEHSTFTFEKSRFVPVVDGEIVPRRPSELLKDLPYLESIGFFERKYLFGVNNLERSIIEVTVVLTEQFFASLEGKSEKEKQAMVADYHKQGERYYIHSYLDTPTDSDQLVDKIMTWYDRRQTGRLSVQLASDLSFLLPAYDFLNTVSTNRSAEGFLLHFNHYPGFMRGPYRGTPHGADLLYWFDSNVSDIAAGEGAGATGEFEEEDFQLKVMFSDMLGQFVKTGNPGNGLREELPGGWPAYDAHGGQYLDFGVTPAIRRHLHHETRDFWLDTARRWASQSGGRSV